MVRRSNDFKPLNPLALRSVHRYFLKMAAGPVYMTMLNDHGLMQMAEKLRQVSAAEFKANCLRLMDEVAQRRRPLLITKRGKPVAKLVPADERPIDLFGYMAGTIKIVGDIVSPIDGVEWTADAENI